MTSPCASVDAALDEAAAGGTLAPGMAAHLAACAECRARLDLARRIDRVLADWPVTAPPPHFAAQVARQAREQAWRQELVIDWGFNIALAASLLVIVAGAAGFLWLLGAAAEPAETSRLALGRLTGLTEGLRRQLPVVAAAMVLVATTVAALWWAEERQRW